MSQIHLEHGDFGTYLLINEDTGKDILIQTDWDYPGIASSFGWCPCKKCGDTDGTVDCAHRTASEMIQEAREYLDMCCDDPITVDDPGYFLE